MLLQTIPNHMDIDSLHKQLTEKFPAILNVHDLHVWQFTKDEIFLTAHIVFISPQVRRLLDLIVFIIYYASHFDLPSISTIHSCTRTFIRKLRHIFKSKVLIRLAYSRSFIK